jgi:ABC-type branched-subunit amino acid transport system substrate-binding protein
MGQEMKSFEREVRMAFEEGIERGLLDRGYELIIDTNAGLPQGTAHSGAATFNQLCDQGCIAVIGANYTDAAIPVAPLANAREVPTVSMCGTDQFHGEYCFRVGNGDVGLEPALIANWLKRGGHETIAVVSPASPIGEEYFDFLRRECRRMGIRIAAMETISMAVPDLAVVLDRLRKAEADALVWCGYGGLFVSGQVKAALEKLKWDPPRICTTAFMQYLHGFDLFEGWTGIDQWCPENPRVDVFLKRFEARYGEKPRMWPNAIPGLIYDMASIVVEGIHRAPILSGPGVKKGIERIRYMPAVTGGPNTHISGGPWDHQLFKGDWLHYGRVKDGKLEFAGLYEATEDY